MIYATTDLDAGSARLERKLGLTVLPGGRHVGQGTHNRIVPLGGGYLELLAICDADEAAASPIGRVLLERMTGDGPLAWAVSGVDVPEVGKWLAGALLPVRVVDGAPAVRAVGIGERELRVNA